LPFTRSQAPVLEVSAASASYGEATVLRGLSLTVQAGEAWVVLGPNGAGKSTLVRLAMGLHQPSEGGLRVCGEAVQGLPPARLAELAAWVPQVTPEDTGFTALELVLMGATARKGPWGLSSDADVARARAALAEVDAAHLEGRPLSRVSGGERRRVWLARALVQAPRLLVLDEPTAFLDVRHQVETLKVVQQRVAAGLAALVVLHDANLAARFATHVLLLRDGEALAAGPAAEVLTEARLSALYGLPMGAPPAGVPIFLPL
jgi:iron complex transport system ATP-binding protein